MYECEKENSKEISEYSTFLLFQRKNAVSQPQGIYKSWENCDSHNTGKFSVLSF